MHPADERLDWAQVERIFLAARQQPPAERAAFVRELAPAAPALVAEVLRLLENDRPDAFLEPPADQALLAELEAASVRDATGRRVVGRYDLDARIGRGGSGVVYRGQDARTGAPVALKLFDRRPGGGGVRSSVEELRALDLPGVVRLLDGGTDPELGAFVVMPLLAGRPFGAGAQRQPWPPVRRTAALLLRTLGALHARGFVHGDLKPGNVLVLEGGVPVVLDLGPRRARTHGERPVGRVVGTPAWMAPEVAAGRLPDGRSDLHAVGLLVFEALAGRPLYGPEHPVTTLLAKQHTDGRQVRSWLGYHRIPRPARPFLRRLLDPDPGRRPRDAREAGALLDPGA